MQHNKKSWFLVLVVFITIIMTSIISLRIQGQKQRQDQDKTQEKIDDDMSQFPITNYDELESANSLERKKGKEKSTRYDNEQLVLKNPPPINSGFTLFDETPPPPAIPTDESEVIVIGQILNVEAHLSNTKGNVYSEFSVQVEESLKNTNNDKITKGSLITADRPGGFVRYRNGQKVLYRIAGRDLPRVGRRYVLFLNNPNQSPNYNILTGYELKEGKVYPFDLGLPFENFNDVDETAFTTIIREAVAKSLPKTNNQ